MLGSRAVWRHRKPRILTRLGVTRNDYFTEEFREMTGNKALLLHTLNGDHFNHTL